MHEVQLKYKIIKKIGESRKRKFNEVFLVENKITQEKAILKHLTKNQFNRNISDRLRIESDFDFQHQGLPSTLDYYEDENEIFLIRSYQSGKTLDMFLNEYRGKRKAEKLLDVLKKIEPILTFLHEQLIYHLDIKPTNILVDEFQDEVNVSLIDFGLAINKNLENERKILFPLGFAAPELILNKLGLADKRTDYFALAVTCWTCLQGRMPLLHANPSKTTNLQLTHPLPSMDFPFTKLSKPLQKLGAKHVFLQPPNLLSNSELEEQLREGMNERYNDLTEFIYDFENAVRKTRKYWFI